MAFKDYALTLNGSAQRLSSVFTDPTVGGAEDLPCRQVIFQVGGANANPVYFGGTSSVSTSVWAFRIEKANATVPPVPFVLGPFSDAGPVKLSSIWVIGTNTEIMHIGMITY